MGREFLGVDLQGWFKGRGIEHQTTAGYASQSNGLAERFLRTMQDGIRALLSESWLGPKFWCYAAYHCMHIYNRLPHSSLDCTPWQACFITVPDLSNVRVFSCRAFVHTPHAKQANKLSERAVSARYLGQAISVGGDHFVLDTGNWGLRACPFSLLCQDTPAAMIPSSKSVAARSSEGDHTAGATQGRAADCGASQVNAPESTK
jgi:hypothetical protein